METDKWIWLFFGNNPPPSPLPLKGRGKGVYGEQHHACPVINPAAGGANGGEVKGVRFFNANPSVNLARGYGQGSRTGKWTRLIEKRRL